MKPISTLGLVLVLLLPALSASAQKVGTTSMQFLKVAPSARAMSMGTAYAAIAGGTDALYWNPAGLTRTQGHALSLDHVDWFMDAAHYGFAYGGSFGNWGYLGVHVYVADMGEFDETRVDHLGFVDRNGQQVYNPGLTGETFSAQSWVVGLTYARKFTDRFSAGLSAKYAREDLWLEAAGAPLFDFGMTYETGFRSVRLGASVQNFGPTISFAEADNDAPLLFRIGAAVDLLGGDALTPFGNADNRLTASYDLIQPNDYDQQWAAGVEYAFLDRFMLRGGYQHNFDTASFSFGAGVRQPFGNIGLGLDYAYSDMTEDFGAVHRFGVQFSFE